MYGENGAAMRRELAALLRQHRIQHRFAGPSQLDRAALGQQILQYRQSLLTWCTQAMQAASPLLFSNLPTKTANPFRAGPPGTTGAGELARALDHAKTHSTAHAASIEQLTTPSDNPVVEHWRELARAAVLAEHDTATEVASHLSAPQAQALVGDVAAISQALVVLDQRYKNTPSWEQLPQGARLGWAALAAALDVNLGQPDYTVDSSGWRPKSKPILGPPKPGILGVLQAEHNLAVRLKSSPQMTNLRLIVDSQRLLSTRLAPFAARIDTGLAEHWTNRAAAYTKLQRQLRYIGGRLGDCGLAAADGANAVNRLAAIQTDTIVEPRVLTGFQTLFTKIDTRIADIIESGVERGVFVKRVTVPRLVTGTGQLVQPVRERYLPANRPSDLDVVQTVRNELRPRPRIGAVDPGPTRADLHAALIHQPTKGEINDVPHL